MISEDPDYGEEDERPDPTIEGRKRSVLSSSLYTLLIRLVLFSIVIALIYFFFMA